MSTTVLRWAAAAFSALALLAGGLQVWAFAETGGLRHVVVGVFALSVGVSVLIAVISATRRGGPPW